MMHEVIEAFKKDIADNVRKNEKFSALFSILSDVEHMQNLPPKLTDDIHGITLQFKKDEEEVCLKCTTLGGDAIYHRCVVIPEAVTKNSELKDDLLVKSFYISLFDDLEKKEISRFIFNDGSFTITKKSSNNTYYTTEEKTPTALALAVDIFDCFDFIEAEEGEFEEIKKALNLRKIFYKPLTFYVTFYKPVPSGSKDKISFYVPGEKLYTVKFIVRVLKTAEMRYDVFKKKIEIAKQFGTATYIKDRKYVKGNDITTFTILIYQLHNVKTADDVNVVKELRVDVENSITYFEEMMLKLGTQDTQE